MDRNEVEHVARVSGKEAAQETLLGLGIDTTKPIETQRDFAHLRWWREIAEGVMKAAVIAMALGFGGTLATLATGVRVVAYSDEAGAKRQSSKPTTLE